MTVLRTSLITHCSIGHIFCAGCFEALARSIAHRHGYDENAVTALSSAYFLVELGSVVYPHTKALALKQATIHECQHFQAQVIEPIESQWDLLAHEDRISFDDAEPLIDFGDRGFIARVLRIRDRVMGRTA